MSVNLTNNYKPQCDHCGTRSDTVRKHHQLNPRTLAIQAEANLCHRSECRAGWTPVDWGRSNTTHIQYSHTRAA